MARIYDEPIKKPEPKPSKPLVTPSVGAGGGTANSSYHNDHRNRMPFHYRSETEDYYFWQYGAIVDIEFILTTSEEKQVQDFTTDVLVNGESVVDERNIANVKTGTMAFADKSLYLPSSEFHKGILALFTRANDIRKNALSTIDLLEKIFETIRQGEEAMNSAYIEELQRQLNELRSKTNDNYEELKTAIENLVKEYPISAEEWKETEGPYNYSCTVAATVSHIAFVDVYRNNEENGTRETALCAIVVDGSKATIYSDIAFNGCVCIGGVNND